MASTIKTLQGEILVSEVEAITISPYLSSLISNPRSPTTVTVVGKSGIKYDLVANYPSALAKKIYSSAVAYVAGQGHSVFDPETVKP